jgi:hypothetical protein
LSADWSIETAVPSQQGYEAINGWHNFGFAELIRVEIRPAPQS